MPHWLLRPADKTKTTLYNHLSCYHFKTLIQKQSAQCDLQTRGYISEIRKSAFNGNIIGFLRRAIQHRFVPAPSSRLRPALALNRPFCTSNKPADQSNNSLDGVKAEEGPLTHHDSYRDLDKLDFMTAAQIYFKTPPKVKKFGLDFHLVQLFFVCMPSLAVYLVAQYARSEMRRMDAELEARNKAKEAKAKEMEQKVAEERAKSDPQMLEVKVRLEKLEETVKEFVIESKKQSATTKNQEATTAKNQEATAAKNQDISAAKNLEAPAAKNQEATTAKNQEATTAKNQEASTAKNQEARIEQPAKTSLGNNGKNLN